MVEDCFDIQDTYGKKQSQLEKLMKAMVIDLQEYPLKTLQEAFVRWRRTKSKIPTPADIIALCEAVRMDNERWKYDLMAWGDFDGTFEQYKIYRKKLIEFEGTKDQWLETRDQNR